MKIAAIVLGPVGIGLIGLLQNLLNTAATIGGLNLAVSGARQIVSSEARDPLTKAASKRAVYLTSCVLAFASGIAFWAFRESLSLLLFQNQQQAGDIGWLAIGVAATVAGGYQVAILSAGRRIGDIARLNLLTGAAASLVGSVCMIAWKSAAIIPFILATPIAALAFGAIFVRRASATVSLHSLGPVKPHVISLLKLGAALTISVFISLCGQLAIRSLIERRLGTVSLGHFQAAWTLTSVYVAFIFQTMASDYLPRLTAVMGDRAKVQNLVESQAEVGLLLGGPIILTMLGCAPWVLSLLYTSQFQEAAELLRYQVLGDVIRLATWPVAFVLLAGGASREYAVGDVTGTIVFVSMTAILLPQYGLASAGVSYIAMNLTFGAIVMLIAFQQYSVVLGNHVVQHFALFAGSCAIIFAITVKFPFCGALAGIAGAVLWSLWGYRRLAPRNLFRRPQEHQ
jgi:O-antigen/teichoic acid export membrane protein